MIKAVNKWVDNGCPLLIGRFKKSRQQLQQAYEDVAKKAKADTDRRHMDQAQFHARGIERVKQAVDGIIEKAATIDWHCTQRPGTYLISLDFDARLLSQLGDTRYEKEIIADRVCRQIEDEIITSKFIRTAHDNERTRRDRDAARTRDSTALYGCRTPEKDAGDSNQPS